MQEVEEAIIRKAQAGDRNAFDRIITVYRQRVFELCVRYMRNREEGLDMAQEVFAQAFGSLKSFEFRSKLSTWFYRMSVNLCINKLDMLKRRRYFDNRSIDEEAEDGSPLFQVADRKAGVDRELEQEETRQILLAAMDTFPADEKNLLVLRDMQGLEYSEISGILDMPVGSVKSKLSRAREKLRQKLLNRKGDLQ